MTLSLGFNTQNYDEEIMEELWNYDEFAIMMVCMVCKVRSMSLTLPC